MTIAFDMSLEDNFPFGGRPLHSLPDVAQRSASHPTLYTRLVSDADRYPDVAFVIEAETGEACDYRTMLRAVHIAQGLLGDQPRTIVLLMPPGIATSIIWLAALTGGHTIIPLAPDVGQAERSQVMARFHPHLITAASDAEVADFVAAGARYLPPLQISELAPDTKPNRPDPKPGKLVLHTSGTTGDPKWIALDAEAIAWTAEQIRLHHHLQARDRGLTPLPFFHINAPVVTLCASLMAGATAIIARRFSQRSFWDWIERYEVTWASVVPTIVAFLLRDPLQHTVPERLRFVRSASSPLPVKDLVAFEERFGIPIIETYGLTEACSQVCANPLPPGRRIPGSVGYPVGVQLAICLPREQDDLEGLRPVPPGSQGEICVSGPSIARGYLDGVSASAFQDGWFRTGDLGYQDEHGALFITGRIREIIKRGGETIAPRAIEEILMQLPDMHEVAVVGRPDGDYGEVPVAFVVTGHPWTPADTSAAMRICRAHLSAFQIPVAFLPIEALPRTPSGKIQRGVLRDLASA